MALSHSTRTALRRFAVRLKYALPALECVLCWVLCALPLWQFSAGDGTIREYQSIFGLLRTSADTVRAVLANASSEATEVLLAKYLRPLPWIVWGVLLVTLLFSWMLLFFSAAAHAREPESLACNRVKVKFRLFFPGRIFHFLLPILTALPMAVPYYVVNRFTQYASVRGNTETESGGTTFLYYDYSVRTAAVNPALILLIVAALALLLFFAAMPFERSLKMDMYRYYDAAEAASDAQPEKPAKRQFR